MCGRFEVDPSVPEIQKIMQLAGSPLPYKTGEIFPGDTTLVVKKEKEVLPMTWGFPQRERKGVIFNARSESALQKPLFRKALSSHPVVVPTTGFYEWTPTPGERRKTRYLFREPGQEVTWLAGFSNRFRTEAGSGEYFTILTTEANGSVVQYHHRMPLVLSETEIADWLEGSHLPEMLKNVPPSLEADRRS